MGNDIITDAMFAIPIGKVTVPQELCDKLKPLEGINQDTSAELYDWDILKNYPDIKKEILNIFIPWVTVIEGSKVDWVMTTSWITENKTGEEMTRHRHLNSVYSGVLYFDKVDEAHPRLSFENPMEIFSRNTIEPVAFGTMYNRNPFNADEYHADIKEGLMLLFPSYLIHKHGSYKSKIPRRSLAFNLFPIGKLSDADSMFDTNLLSY